MTALAALSSVPRRPAHRACRAASTSESGLPALGRPAPCLPGAAPADHKGKFSPGLPDPPARGRQGRRVGHAVILSIVGRPGAVVYKTRWPL